MRHPGRIRNRSFILVMSLAAPSVLADVASAQTVPSVTSPAALPSPQGTPSRESPPPKVDGKLTEGLLDLLTEPERKQPSTKPVDPNKPASDPVKDGKRESGSPNSPSKNRSPGQSPDGEQSNPLFEVRVAMSTVADMLRSSRELQKTRQLQNDIVSRLDDLIGTLEDQPASEQSNQQSQSGESSASSGNPSPQSGGQPQSASPGSSGQSSSAQSSEQSPNSSGARTSDADQAAQQFSGRRPNRGGAQGGESQTGEQSSGQSRSGEEPAAGSSPEPPQNGSPSELAGQSSATGIGNRQAIVDLNDPGALQRSAWGNLPERVRQQMQSRMVERFLPGYRQEIEAYYRALAK